MATDKGDRRDALGDLDPTLRALLDRGKKERKRPRFPCEERRTKATWDLPPELVQRVRDMSKELGVPQYALVEKLLRHGLDLYDGGELELRRKAVTVTYTLE